MADINLLKLRRFLHYGNITEYKAGNAAFNAGPKDAEDPARKVVSHFLDNDKSEQVIDEIVRYLNMTISAHHTHREAAIYALAQCARHKDNDAERSNKTKEMAMKAMATCLHSTSDLFAFITYCKSLVEGSGGWGRSLKTGIRRWFDSRDSMTLAKIISQKRTAHGWSYKDLLRVTHIQPKTEGKLSYVVSFIVSIRINLLFIS